MSQITIFRFKFNFIVIAHVTKQVQINEMQIASNQKCISSD